MGIFCFFFCSIATGAPAVNFHVRTAFTFFLLHSFLGHHFPLASGTEGGNVFTGRLSRPAVPFSFHVSRTPFVMCLYQGTNGQEWAPQSSNSDLGPKNRFFQ